MTSPEHEQPTIRLTDAEQMAFLLSAVVFYVPGVKIRSTYHTLGRQVPSYHTLSRAMDIRLD